MGRDGAPPGGATPLAGGRRAPAPIGCRSAFDLHTAGPRSRHARVEARRAALKGTALGARGAGAGAAAGRGPSGGGGRAMGPPRLPARLGPAPHRQPRKRGSSQGTHHVARRLLASPSSGSGQEGLRATVPGWRRWHRLLLRAAPRPGCCHNLQGTTCRPCVSGGRGGTEKGLGARWALRGE